MVLHKSDDDMLQLNLSETEIQRLNYEWYYYPVPLVQKRIHAVNIKASTSMSNKAVGRIVGLRMSCCYPEKHIADFHLLFQPGQTDPYFNS